MRPNLLSSDRSARAFLHHWGIAELCDAVAFNGVASRRTACVYRTKRAGPRGTSAGPFGGDALNV
jgi:hypothetical protein